MQSQSTLSLINLIQLDHTLHQMQFPLVKKLTPTTHFTGLTASKGKLRYRVELVKQETDHSHPNVLNSKENVLHPKLGIIEREISYDLKPQNRQEGRQNVMIESITGG